MRYRMELLDNDFMEVRNVEMDLVMGGVSLRCDPNSPDPDNPIITGCVVINKDAKEIAAIMARCVPNYLEQAPVAVASHVERSGYAGFKALDKEPQPLRIERLLGTLMADAALVIARAFAERQNGKVKVETKEKFGELIVELYHIWFPSRFGSYDAERRVHDDYFAHSYPSDPRA
jgi:hypothetical protein